ncbi:serine hydrolase [Pseudorhodoferax sp. Leaf274]|uniref:serine hydrolase n=1 Tax=Pseudorhodoferax sp. Leaf274 TaxID=1736318 RepID=UPI001F449E26|nr:serine hydrolase [Pseudorhodoferax sp. Leaf274]
MRALSSGESLSFRADQSWYLASTVKVPVAIAVLRGIARGAYTLDTPVTLRADDYVDGAGSTNSHAVGTALPIRTLLEQMIIHSDNTASDMLIGLVGLEQVNAVVTEVAPAGFGPITRLAEVRRATYGQLAPAAQRLAGRELLVLRQQRDDGARLQYLARIVQVPVSDFRLATLGEAYDAYYATGLNAGRLDAYGELLAQLADGRLLPPTQTRHLLGLMERVVTGPQRIRAGLPAGMRFAHKTGTQRGRFCDAGIVQPAGGATRVLVVACTRGELSLVRAERALREVGAALCRSGVLTQGVPDAPSCAVRLPAAGRAGAP